MESGTTRLTAYFDYHARPTDTHKASDRKSTAKKSSSKESGSWWKGKDDSEEEEERRETSHDESEQSQRGNRSMSPSPSTPSPSTSPTLHSPTCLEICLKAVIYPITHGPKIPAEVRHRDLISNYKTLSY